MSKTYRNQHQADSQAGFATGKRVWFKTTFDAQVVARNYGVTTGTLAQKDPDSYARRLLDLGDGRVVWIAEQHLRLTPPPSLSGKQERTKETKPPRRKEAIKPDAGYEQTIYDVLGE